MLQLLSATTNIYYKQFLKFKKTNNILYWGEIELTILIVSWHVWHYKLSAVFDIHISLKISLLTINIGSFIQCLTGNTIVTKIYKTC